MSYTKGELVFSALEEIGIASYEYDVSAEQVDSGVRRLDAMMAEWDAKGIKVSYPISQTDKSFTTDDSNVPDWAWEAIITNLALKMAPSYGKEPSMQTKISAKKSLNTLLGLFAGSRESQLESMPRGAGYKSVSERRWTPQPKETYLKQVDEDVDLSGGPEDA